MLEKSLTDSEIIQSKEIQTDNSQTKNSQTRISLPPDGLMNARKYKGILDNPIITEDNKYVKRKKTAPEKEKNNQKAVEADDPYGLFQVPQLSHNHIAGIRHKLSDSNISKWFSSTNMKNVLTSVDSLEKILSSKTFYPCNDQEFEANLKEVKEAYLRLKSYGNIYVENAGASFSKGKQRLKIVKDLVYQVTVEYQLLEHTIREKRKEAILRDDDTDITFEDVLKNSGNLVSPASEALNKSGRLYDYNENNKRSLVSSRVFDLLGASDMVISYDEKIVKQGDKYKRVVYSENIPKAQDTIQDVMLENHGKEIQYTPEAQKQLNTIKIVNILLGYATADRNVLCSYQVQENKVIIDRVVAKNAGFADDTPMDLVRRNARALFNSIKRENAQIDADVLNEIISMTAREFSELFGDLLKNEERKTLAERIRVIRQEVVDTGLDDALGLFKRNSTSEIVVSEIVRNDLKNTSSEVRRERKKKKYADMISEMRQTLLGQTIILDDNDPLNELFKLVLRYSRQDTTMVGEIAGRLNTQRSEEEDLANQIRTSAEDLINSYAQDPNYNIHKHRCVNIILSKFAKNTDGKLEPIPRGARVIDHTGPGEEPQFTVDTTGIWQDKTNAPLFPHEPCVNDTKQGDIGDCFFVAAIASVVAEQPWFIKNIMRDNKNGTVTVKLHTFEGGKFIPIYVKVNKTVPKKRDGRGDLYAKGCLWMQMLEKAFVCSDILQKIRFVGGDAIFGENGEYSLDYDDKHFKNVVGDFQTTEVDGQGKVTSRGLFQRFEGGFGESVIPILTGKSMKKTESTIYEMYFGDYAYSGLTVAEKDDVDNKAKFINIGARSEKGNQLVLDIMRINDSKKAHKRTNVSQAKDSEMTKGLYCQITGSDVNAQVDKDTMLTTIRFTNSCLRYMDDHAHLNEKDYIAIDHFPKLMKDFLTEYPQTLNNRDKAKFTQFVASDEFKKVRRYIRESIKRADDRHYARYTLYSGNYYGKALEVYNKLKQGQNDKETMLAAGSSYLLGKDFRKRNTDGTYEGDANGLYTQHEYSVHGVTEKKFGGKTYKFVLVRNPWGLSGTEYYYNPKKKSLARRISSKEQKTEGYTLVELSEFVMGFDSIYIGGKPIKRPKENKT